MENEHNFPYYKQMVHFAMGRGCDFQDAQDRVQDSILKALGSHDPARGTMKSLCFAILRNELASAYRGREEHVAWDDEHPELGDETQELERELRESEELLTQTLQRIKLMLTEEELAFLEALKQVAEENEAVVVSEAARRMNLTPQQGFDILRRIQRRAKKGAPITPPTFARRAATLDEIGRMPVPRSAVRSTIPQEDLDQPSYLFKRIPMPPVPSAYWKILAQLGVRSSFEDFFFTLAPEEQALWESGDATDPS